MAQGHLNTHLHFRFMVIESLFASERAGGVIFHAATGIEERSVTKVHEQVRRGSARCQGYPSAPMDQSRRNGAACTQRLRQAL